MKKAIGVCPACGKDVHTGEHVLLDADGHVYHGYGRCPLSVLGQMNRLFPASLAEPTRDARRAAEKEEVKNAMFGDED